MKPYAVQYLQLLKAKGVPMCIATATGREHVEMLLAGYGLLQYFDFIVTVSEFGKPKAEPELFLDCAMRLGIAPKDCTAFEDALYALRTLAAAGFQTVAVADRFSEPDEPEIHKVAGRYIKSFSELL